MRNQIFGRRLKRTNDQRKALFTGLISSMIIQGKITTTEAKAKSVRGELEKLVTNAKKGKKREIGKTLKPFEQERMMTQIAPVFKDRPGGYTRIIKTGNRFSDSASMAILEWTDKIEFGKKEDDKKTKTKTKKTAKTKTTKKKVVKTDSKKKVSKSK